jgi:glycosyltransferase involved in cell wall biosynthesis
MGWRAELTPTIEMTQRLVHSTDRIRRLISVVIPAHRAAVTLGRAVTSALAQVEVEVEVIVVDDASGDDSTRRVLEAFQGHVRLVELDTNVGAAGARNAGIRLAQGEFIAFLDADDEWLPDKLASQLSYFTEDSSVVLVVTDAQILLSNGRSYTHFSVHPPHEGALAWKGLLADNFIITSGAMVRASALEVTGLFDSALLVGEDLDLWIKLALVGEVRAVRAPLTRYHQQVGSLMMRTRQGEITYVLPMLLAHTSRLSGQLTPAERRFIEGKRLFDFAFGEYRAGRVTGLSVMFWRSFRRRHRLAKSLAYAILSDLRAVTTKG